MTSWWAYPTQKRRQRVTNVGNPGGHKQLPWGGCLSNVTVSIPHIHGDFGNGLWNRVYQTLSYTNNKTPANELPPNQASVMRNFRTAETLSCDALGSDRRSTSPTEDSHQVEDSFSIFLGIFRHGPWAVAYDVSMICNPLSHGLGTNIKFLRYIWSGNIYKYKRLLKLHWKVACGHCRRLSCWTNTTKNTVQPAPFFLLSLRPASKHLKIFTSCCQQPPVKEQGGPWCQVKFQGFDLCSEVQRIEGMLLVCGQRKATNLCVKMNFMLFIHLDTKSQGWKGW